MSGPVTNPKLNQNVIRFGVFELHLRSGELRKSGIKIKLQEQPFQILVTLLERPGEIVTREELQKRLWPGDTFVDFDLSLNSAVKKLRQALGDDSENPRFIETLYRRGYRFIGQINGTPGVSESTPVPSTPSPVRVDPGSQPTKRLNIKTLAWIIPAALVVIAAAIGFTRSSPPLILAYTQLTHDGLAKGSLVTDGERLYFAELRGDHFSIAQVSVRGGETSLLATPFPEVYPPDIAADGSALLVSAFSGTKEGPLYSLPLPSGSPQRLQATGHAATWSPDRSQLVYASGSDLYLTHGNDGQPRKLATIEGAALDLRFSTDGRRLRFSVLTPNSDFSSLWEVNVDGSNLHPLLPGWNPTPHECCGRWTPNGKYFVFQSIRDGRTNLWVLSDRSSWLHLPKPVQLTNGPLDFTAPAVSKDGKTIFAVGSKARGELVRYNGTDFVPFLEGISATDVSFSPDGKSVAYVSVPEGILWRSNVDGTHRLQLTQASLHTALPKWSPDGKHIVFMGQTPGANWRAYLIDSDGGAPRDVVPAAQAGFDPGWSPDGKSVALTLNEGGTLFPLSGPGIAIVEVATGEVSLVSGATQLFSPRWSPDGRYIAAITADSQKLLLFDRITQKWTDLVSMPIGYPSWSHDGGYLYFDAILSDDPALFRVRMSDRKLERVASLAGVRRFWGQFGAWTGLTPDDSLLLVRDISSQEIYALQWQAP